MPADEQPKQNPISKAGYAVLNAVVTALLKLFSGGR